MIIGGPDGCWAVGIPENARARSGEVEWGKTANMMKHLTLLGDSIFDNKAYVRGGNDTITSLRDLIPTGWEAELAAIDGDVVTGVAGQLRKVSPASTHLFISVGGNDAIREMNILNYPVTSSSEVLNSLADTVAAFEERYEAMLQQVLALRKPTAICTIYYPRFEGMMQKLAVAALASFNDVIIRQAFINSLPLIDLRLVCSQDSDYANAIEPSEKGGAKIARAILEVSEQHDFGVNRTAVYF